MPQPDESAAVDIVDDIIMPAVRIVRQTFRVALPGIVTSFARDTGRAAVEFGAKWLAMDRSVRDEPPVPDLPVITPRGGGYGVYFDFTEGDLGIVIAQDGPVRGLYETGAPNVPQFPQGHDFGCGVILPGGRVSSTETPTPPPNPAGTLLVGADDLSAAVEFRGTALSSPSEAGAVVVHAAGPASSLLLGSGSAAVPAACAPQALSNFQAINTAIQGLPVVPGDPGVIPALKTAFGAWVATLSDMADAKVRLDGPAGP